MKRSLVTRVALRVLFWTIVPVVLGLMVTLAVRAATYDPSPGSWRTSRTSSADILPDPKTFQEASIRVFQARVRGMRGMLAVHSWVVVKKAGGQSWERFDVMGWGSTPLRRNSYVADGYWFGARPELVVSANGPRAEEALPKVMAAIRSYPHNDRGGYRMWPGPNSNTFVAYVLDQVPELEANLSPLAIGKDYPTGEDWILFRQRKGWTSIGVLGLVGITYGDRLSLSLFGLTIGFDFANGAAILPGYAGVHLAEDAAEKVPDDGVLSEAKSSDGLATSSVTTPLPAQ